MRTWNEIVAANPDHSEQYAARWRQFQVEGKDIDGEARFIDAMAARGSRIFDAGCGTGRIGGYLSDRGHEVYGVDLDPTLISYAQQDFPAATWAVGDLAAGDRPAGEFDITVCGGNVFWFIAEQGRVPALQTIAASLTDTGRAVIAFGAGRGYLFSQFFRDCEQAGLTPVMNFAGWDITPFHDRADYLVSMLAKTGSAVLPPQPLPRFTAK
ncbi:class I SAM-dependent DNA methyltransferase [Corynebacterium choanae]|uniref:Magnesium-protoporphyrin O-methyltransferase n=1 Tax=Corynebacterium choanae TaxID=1862358 RepID=A0A3G6J9F1_9CORY|nr:methyltransferase domain-containing protein [Corynebacterium choanae]AZA13518.1 Magnesium-protoporphyrin O-methyltransferase [Corynebacterium choanae]